MRKKDVIISISIVAGVIVMIIIAFIVFTSVIIPKGLEEHEKEDYGFIRLPNNYCVIKVSETNRNLALMETDVKTGENYYSSVVDFDIDAISWNDRYVFYHITNKESLNHESPGSKRFQILDTKTGEISTYITLDDSNQALSKIDASNLELKSVLDFFPETKGSSHTFALN